MTGVVSKVMKINIRARSKDRIQTLLGDILGGVQGPDRGSNTIGDFDGAIFNLGGVVFDVMIPNDDNGALARVIDKHGEGIDSICFAVEDMDYTESALKEQGIDFASRQSFHGNEVAFARPRDTCGISLEFIQGATKSSE